MEKFGMSFGVGGAGRKELLETIEAQKKQLVQYQTRFRDVVQAYRSLLKEKEALESSLQVLTGSQEGDQQDQDPPEDCGSLHSEASVDLPETVRDQTQEDQGGPGGPPRSETSGSESGGAEQQQATPPAGSEADRRVAQLKSQLSTLSGAVSTVTQEKSRMEASFQADRRQLRQEVEELQERLVAVTTQQEAEIRSLQQQLTESRARIITQQHEREQEQRDHVLQLQELTCILQQQRLLMTSQDADRGAEPQDAEEDQTRPDPRVDLLQRELLDLKNQVQDQVHIETRRACQAEERARERAQAAELRVAGLEQRLSELSELLGSCEKAKQREQQAAQRLRERILQLDTENKMLAMAASSRSTSDRSLDESQLDVAALKEKLEKVKKQLLLVAQRNPDQTPVIQNLAESVAEPDGASALACQQELRQLKDEFERYKLRAQVVLKNKNAKDGCQARELEEVRDQLAELKEKYINLRIQSDEAEARHRQQLEERQQQAAALQQSHRQEVERMEALHRDELLRLEAELHKQRERTMALLDEKDQELERLRTAALSLNTPRSAGTNTADEGAAAEESEGDVISQALWRAAPTEPTLLLYAEQLARKEVEAGALRRQKHQLEDDVHQLQAKLIVNAERHDEEAAELRGRLDKLIRDQSREGANMEYLKNVIYKFLTLQDASGRQQTLTAILTILHFSPQEKHDVMRLQGATWWSSSKR